VLFLIHLSLSKTSSASGDITKSASTHVVSISATTFTLIDFDTIQTLNGPPVDSNTLSSRFIVGGHNPSSSANLIGTKIYGVLES
jgi:hypothetical protein